MELWTEYEGRTIDDVFPLTKLLRPEGRSAFFSTTNGTGVPRLIRLIESHFDDDEILARWRGVAALDHPNLLKLQYYGPVLLDDTSLVYAVMEPVDANLGDVLNGQRLTVADTRQLAASMAAALAALHSHGFVHEHVEPSNVFAVGEVVKLRGDCIREAPEGNEGQRLKQRDASDLAVLLLKALTQKWTIEDAVSDLPLPEPFDRIVRKGISGEWGVAEISSALAPEPKKEAVSPLPAAPPIKPTAAAQTKPSSEAAVSSTPKQVATSGAAARPRRPVDESFRTYTPETIPRSSRGWMTIAAIVLLVILAFWGVLHFVHSRITTQNPAPQEAAATSHPVDTPAPKPSAAKISAPKAFASRPAASSVTPSVAPNNNATSARDQWRVIAFTYNHEDQAQHKSATIAQQHPELRPEVFTPTGHAPYLVTVGGAMTRDEAFALVAKVRNEGLPRDSYAQNYSSKGPG